MAILGLELEEIARLIALVEAQKLDELIIESEGRYVRIRGSRRDQPAAPSKRLRASPKSLAPPAAPEEGAALADDLIALVSPMVGLFYRSDRPGSPPLIDIGQHVSMGQTIGIIEAMKIFSEVPAEHSGTVVSVPAEDGKLVHAGDPLVILRKEL